MDVVSGTQEGLLPELCSKVARYRHQVFVERLGWQLPTSDGAELDQFDRPDTIYVVAQESDGRIVGCARLLPTTRPYLLAEVFPQLLNGLPLPRSPDVWELSRFSATDLTGQLPTARGQFSSPVAVRLLQASIACAASHGARRLITVSPIGVERLLQKARFHAYRAGPPVVVDGHPIIACWIEVETNYVGPDGNR